MNRFAIKDAWTKRLLGLCGALAFLLLINSLWRPEPRLPGAEAQETRETPSSEEAPAGTDAPDTDAPNAPDADVAAALEAQTIPTRTIKPLPAYGMTLQRPLFQATRRPAPVKPKIAKPKTPPKPKAPPRSNLNGVRLTGVIMTAEKAFGLLSIPGQSELMRAPEGHVVKGWKVIGVEEDALVLNNGEEDFRMALWEDKPGQGTQGTAGRGAAGQGTSRVGARPGNMAGNRP